MIITTVITILMLILGVVVADGSAIKNCCNVAVKDHYFSINKNSSRVYTIIDLCGQGTRVQGYCDTVTDGGGWMVIQRRKDGSEDFNRFWWEYEMGFGSLTGEFWYGLHAIHCLTNLVQSELRIDYTFTNGTKGYLSYSNFRVGPASAQYPLTISGFDGVTTDPFYISPSHREWSLNQMNFTTRDRDNDHQGNGYNCAVHNYGSNGSGGWWYNYCSDIVLNNQHNHMYTIRLNGQWFPLPFVEMKIRPKKCII
ncbi:fibrinogen C domain-containing protein 1-B-like [Dysidea avara]|uniref:fibrinogen C domain-containing protein 1-B-like n=1 Tax=Dysidea avara TaxID=196820 RepID=UPI003324E2F5